MLIEEVEEFADDQDCATLLGRVAEEDQRADCFENEIALLSFDIPMVNLKMIRYLSRSPKEIKLESRA